MQRIEIDKNKPLNPGDVIELEYKTAGKLWIPSIQIAMIEWQLSKRDDWEILSNSLPTLGRITFKVLIKSKVPDDPKLQTAGIGVTALMISGAIVAVGLVTWLTLDKVYQFVEIAPKTIEELTKTPGGQVVMAGAGSLGIALLVYVIMKYVKW
jgi:hypothetical protein